MEQKISDVGFFTPLFLKVEKVFDVDFFLSTFSKSGKGLRCRFFLYFYPLFLKVEKVSDVDFFAPLFLKVEKDLNTMYTLSINNMDETFEQLMLNYVQTNNPKLYILTPCYGGMIHSGYLHCFMETMKLCNHFQLSCNILTIGNDSLVSRARNHLVAAAMNDPGMTHVLFIDSDISWNPMDVLKLMLDNKPIVGGIYPKKKYLWNKLVDDQNIVQKWLNMKENTPILKSGSIKDEDFIQYQLVDYNLNYLNEENRVENNLVEVKHVATGFMMIQRETIEKLMRAYSFTKFKDNTGCFLKPHEQPFCYALFDCGVEEGEYLSEDWMFCNRWRKIGGSIYMNITTALTHTGSVDYKGNLFCSLLGKLENHDEKKEEESKDVVIDLSMKP